MCNWHEFESWQPIGNPEPSRSDSWALPGVAPKQIKRQRKPRGDHLLREALSPHLKAVDIRILPPREFPATTQPTPLQGRAGQGGPEALEVAEVAPPPRRPSPLLLLSWNSPPRSSPFRSFHSALPHNSREAELIPARLWQAIDNAPWWHLNRLIALELPGRGSSAHGLNSSCQPCIHHGCQLQSLLQGAGVGRERTAGGVRGWPAPRVRSTPGLQLTSPITVSGRGALTGSA